MRLGSYELVCTQRAKGNAWSFGVYRLPAKARYTRNQSQDLPEFN